MNKLALITALKMSLAGLAAFVLIQLFHLPLGVWSLVTIAAIAQAGFSKTLVKAVMRIIGTFLGALAGYLIVVVGHASPLVTFLLLVFGIWSSSYIALQPSIYSYAGIVAGMTMSIVLFYSLSHEAYMPIIVDRSFEVLLGVVILGLISALLFQCVKLCHWQFEKTAPFSWRAPSFRFGWTYAIPACKVALACLLTFLIWRVFHQAQGYWATITCLLIMEENRQGTVKKGWFRFLSHALAALIALLLLYVLREVAYDWRLLPLMITFAACGYLIGSNNKYAGMGNTLGVAFAIMLFTNAGVHESTQLVFARFFNVVLGVGVAYLFLMPLERFFVVRR